MKAIIVGGGQVGAYLAALLMERGSTVSIVEESEQRRNELLQQFPSDIIVAGSGTDPGTLETAGIQDAQVVAAVTGKDEINLVVATLARMEYGVARVIGRVNNPKNAWLFTPAMGVDVGINQADLMARLAAEEMTMGDMMTLLNLHRGEYSLVEKIVAPASEVAGKAIRTLQLPAECVFTALIRDNSLIIPRGDTVLKPMDKVVAITHVSHVRELSRLLDSQKKKASRYAHTDGKEDGAD